MSISHQPPDWREATPSAANAATKKTERAEQSMGAPPSQIPKDAISCLAILVLGAPSNVTPITGEPWGRIAARVAEANGDRLEVLKRELEAIFGEAEAARIAQEIIRVAEAQAEPQRALPPKRYLDDLFLPSLPDHVLFSAAKVYVDAMTPCTEAPAAFHLGAFLTVVGGMLGRSVWLSQGRDLFANLFVLLSGDTGKTRKSTAAALAYDYIVQRLEPRLYEERLESVGSAEVFVERCAEAEMSSQERQAFRSGSLDPTIHSSVLHRRVLMYEDEMATLLQKARRESTGALLPRLTSAWDMPLALKHTTRARDIVAYRPAVSFLACSTPSWLKQFSKIDDVLGGFTNRFLFFQAAPGQPLPRPPKPDEVTINRLTLTLAEILAFYREHPRELPLSSEASKRWDAFYVERHQLEPSSDVVGALTERAGQNALKVALIYAALDKADAIELQHLEAGIAVAMFSAGVLKENLADITDNHRLRIETAIERLLRKFPRTPRELAPAMQRYASCTDIRQALADMDAIGRVRQMADGKYEWLG